MPKERKSPDLNVYTLERICGCMVVRMPRSIYVWGCEKHMDDLEMVINPPQTPTIPVSTTR